jgi:single-strand DNA-binding protein
MAADNHTTIVGNLVEDPELRFTNTGIAVTNLRVAVTQRIQQDGQWRDGDTSFFKVNIWRGQAEHLADSLSKGDRVMVTGRLRQRSWDTPEGKKRSVTELEADEVGASLKWATAKVERTSQRGNGERSSGRERSAERGVDLVGALREAADQVLGHPLELAVAMSVRRCPLHSERPGQRPLVGGPVDGVGGQPMAVQIPAVQGRPAAVRSLDAVGDDQMGMQKRIAVPGCPVVEADRQQPLTGHVLDTTVATAGPQMLVQVADRFGQPGMMG